MRFYKYEACGNDYVYFDCRRREIADDKCSTIAKSVSDRRFGIGGDGAVFICSSGVADAKMKMFNADGSRGAICGNALRCATKYLRDYGGLKKRRVSIETDVGNREVTVKEDEFIVNMGEPNFDASGFAATEEAIDESFTFDRKRTVTLVSMGNPHCVTFVPRTDFISVPKIGKRICGNDLFFDGANVEFVEVTGENELKMRVYERGSGETFGCGSGACAAAIAAIRTGRVGSDEITVHMRGGTVKVGFYCGNVYLIGGAREVFTGDVKLEI